VAGGKPQTLGEARVCYPAPLRPFANSRRVHVVVIGISVGGARKGAHLLATCLWLKQSGKASLLKVAVAGERF
jgi:hypothetical protein